MAQMPRAILLASAIATSIRGFLAIIRANHEPSGTPFWEAHLTTAMAPRMRRRRMSRCPIFEILPSLCLPPVDFCKGASPSQAEKSRPRLKISIGGAKVSIARAAIGPSPGIVCKRRDVSASLDSASIVFFSVSSRSVIPAIRFKRSLQISCTRSGNSVFSASTISARRRRWPMP